MTRIELQEQIMAALASVAPEIDSASLHLDAPLRDQVDIDSMDFLRFLIEVRNTTGVSVPEADYGKLVTVNGIVDYLLTRAPATTP